VTGRPPGRHLVERLFLAVELDDETRHALAARLDPFLAGGALPGRPVPIENWHVTLRFLGDTSAVQRDLALERLTRHHLGRPFRVRFGALGAFPDPHRAAVVWLAVAGGAEDLVDLAAAAEDASQGVGFSPEDRPFHPHLTLSRVRPPENVTPLIEAVPSTGVSMTVDAVVLYRSILSDGPARYEVVERIPLV